MTTTASALSRIGGALSILLIAIVLALTTVGVVARYVLGHPLEGVDEACGYLVVAMVMAGAAEALRTGHHIRIDLIMGFIGPRGRRWLDAWSNLAVLVFAVLLVRTGWHSAAFSYDFDAFSSGQLELPLWIPQATLPIGAVLLGVVAFAKLIAALAGIESDERTGGH
ncbi:TRAP transporter [Azospirillum sp. TSH100]|nr:TRAP transporter [Azospirillum sp. TSH100]